MQDFITKYHKNGKAYLLYRSTCSKCGIDRGFQQKNRLHLICKQCSDISKRESENFDGQRSKFQSFCVDCGADRGFQRKIDVNKKCVFCASKFRIKRYGNHLAGRIQPEEQKSKQRKCVYSNVDLSDFITKPQKSGKNAVRYRMKCPTCNEDKGYMIYGNAKNDCKKCAVKKRTFYTNEQRLVRSRMKANLVARLKQRLMLKNKKSTFDILGYTVDNLKQRIESQFKPGMTWDNYGEWQIDHITPDSWFKYNSMEDDGFKKSWALENLQPLWASENRSKGNRYEG